MRTNVYIDGFNLYYGCLRHTPYRWLNLEALCRVMLPRDNIQSIKYFVARIEARPHNAGKAARQETYFRALGILPLVSITYGHYLVHEVWMPEAGARPGQRPRMVKVIRTEEKGSDVNLAAHLLLEACRNNFDTAVVISNDSDLLEPIRIVQQEFGKTVGVLNPQKRPSVQLHQQAHFFKQIEVRALKRSQFPTTLEDANGTLSKPGSW